MKIVQVAGGWDFSLAVTVEGELFSWGNNIFCQLGRNSSHKGSTCPARVEFPDKVKVAGVAAGLRHGLAKTDDGAVYGWGDNKRQQVVNFDDKVVCSKVQSPMRLTLPLQSKVVQVAAGAYHSGALTETREVHLWGCKRFGQISAKAEGSSSPA
ncbi:secretion-regulating guanine nucleotide exchange factor-like [Pomacea canaliculata]|uniref:secretion-regulating guanine nucleotide exchange factor-like n=1 Tax=Pomacea canaliculata TaxID=400727 RepID=UPI000D73E602|nr:secretion-regulating guanine nucleotide exchange factor-like [Pomacea canaliculata]XP_025087872.1 secretion-regulating guanine nucleotide exchange factor-like [Pomacea canaliculata]XP_025087873.1 secretion-regulating guanine nucleotide exchange factor-like [Pomacea canaliculata]XP_025087874.1 secretion-regulating guanine nucleotide exchange factor-like [Pomacea canaliculata]